MQIQVQEMKLTELLSDVKSGKYKDSPVPGLTHRYPDRVLMVTTHVSTMYCRFCTRKRVTMDRDGWDGPSHNDQRMVQYLREHQEVHDVIVSRGRR